MGKIPWRKEKQRTPVFWLGEFHGQRAEQATVQGVAKSQTRLSDFHLQVVYFLDCFFFLFKKFYFFIFSFSCAGSWLLHRLLSSCGTRGLLSSCSEWASHCWGFSCCRVSTGSVVVAHGSATLRHVGSSGIRDWTSVCCTGRHIFYHWATRIAWGCKE